MQCTGSVDYTFQQPKTRQQLQVVSGSALQQFTLQVSRDERSRVKCKPETQELLTSLQSNAALCSLSFIFELLFLSTNNRLITINPR